MSSRVSIHDLAVGGDGVGRLDDGRVVFVPGAAVDDILDIEIVEEKKRFARGRIVDIVVEGQGRRQPPCPQVALGCGGCDWQHLTEEEQVTRKVATIGGIIERMGGVAPPEIEVRRLEQPFGYRTQLRMGVESGQAAFRARGSNGLIPTTQCLVAHPLFDMMIGEPVLGRAGEAVLRVAPSTGERMALLDPTSDGHALPAEVIVFSTNEIESGEMTFYVDVVADRPWQVSATSFFQSSGEGAGLLIDSIEDALSHSVHGTGHLVDLYGGVGLFSGTIGTRFDQVTLVEASLSAVEDAAVNLDGRPCSIVHAAVENWEPVAADVVIADPPRTGLKARIVDKISVTGADHVVLVSCDAGSLGRDAGLLNAAGFGLNSATLVDLFPQTSHVEVVTGWSRSDPA